MATALDNIKSNLSKPAAPSLLDKALSFFGVSKAPATPPAGSGSTALQNIQKSLGVTPQVTPSAGTPPAGTPPAPAFDASKIPANPDPFGLNSSIFATHEVVVQNPPPVTLSDIFKKSADIITAVPKALIDSELHPSQEELNLEQAFNTKPDASNFEKVVNVVPSILAKGVFRFFQPIFQPYASDLADAIVSQEIAPQVASGAIPYSEFEKLFPALQKSNAQVLGDSIQAGLAVYLPNVFAEGAAATAGTGFKSALAQGLKTGAVSGGIFGTAQVLSSGTTDPKEIADIFAKNIVGGALLGAVTHATIPLSKEAMTKMTSDITTKFDMPTEVYIDPAKVREALNPTSAKAVDGIKVKVTPAEADLVRSLGLSEDAYKKAATEGVTVSIPATKVIQITDKPYFAAIKDTFGFKPSEKTITIKGEPSVVRNVRSEPAVVPERSQVSRETAPVTPPDGLTPPEAPKPEQAPQNTPEAAPVTSYEVKQGARGISVVVPKEDGLMKSPASRVAEAIGGRFVNREGGYGFSATKLAQFQEAMKAVDAGTLEAPPLLANKGEKASFRKQFTAITRKAQTQADIVKAEVAKQGEAKIKDIVAKTKILEPNVRRILGVGAKEGTFERVGDGVYKLNHNGKDIAFIQTANAVEALPKLAKDGFKADMVFLDIPYDTPAVKGGNRGVKYDLLSVSEFKTVMSAVSDIVRDEHTPVLYMYSQAVSGEKQMAAYNKVLIDEGFKPIAKGEWQKLFQNGLPVTNVRGKVAAPEGILLLTKSGKFDKADVNLNFKLVRPKGYSTEKPEAMLSALIKTTTKAGETVLDPFAGSGVTGAAAIKAGRKAYLIERNKQVVETITKPRLEAALKDVPKDAQVLAKQVPKYATAEEFVKGVTRNAPDNGAVFTAHSLRFEKVSPENLIQESVKLPFGLKGFAFRDGNLIRVAEKKTGQFIGKASDLIDNEKLAIKKAIADATTALEQEGKDKALAGIEGAPKAPTDGNYVYWRRATDKNLTALYNDVKGKVGETKVPAPVADSVPVEKPTPSAESIPPVNGEKTSGVAKSIIAKAIEDGLAAEFKDLAGYDPATVKEQTSLVSGLIENELPRVKRIIAGQESLPSNIRGAMFIAGVEKYAREIGDVGLIQDLASSGITSETSLHASELRLLQERDPSSPVALIKSVQDARTKAIEKSDGKPINKAKTAIATEEKPRLVEALKKTSPKRPSWEEFVKSIEC